jgi:hypothetical protein
VTSSGATFWRWGSLAHVTALRAAVLGIWLVIVALTPYGDYSRLPLTMSEGYSLGRLLLGVPALKAWLLSHPVLLALQGGGVLSCALALLYPNRCRWLTPVALGFVFVLDHLTRSFNGYVNHAQLAPLFMLFIVAILGGKRHLPTLGLREGQDPSGRGETILWLAALMIVIPYTFIALNRMLVGGVEVFRGDALLDYINLTSRRYSVYGSDLFLGLIRVAWLGAGLKVGFFVTTLFEVTSFAALLSRAYRRAWLVVIVAFHFVTLFAMNIFFWENLILILVIFGWGIWRREPLAPA